jgi:hypothetical protein
MNGFSQKSVVEGAVEMTVIGAKSRKERSAQREALSARLNGDKKTNFMAQCSRRLEINAMVKTG